MDERPVYAGEDAGSNPAEGSYSFFGRSSAFAISSGFLSVGGIIGLRGIESLRNGPQHPDHLIVHLDRSLDCFLYFLQSTLYPIQPTLYPRESVSPIVVWREVLHHPIDIAPHQGHVRRHGGHATL